MSLENSVKDVLAARNRQSSEKEWTILKLKLEEEIRNEKFIERLTKALSLDINDLLPFEQKKLLFEKIIALERNKEYLQNFAWWLQLNGGPDWDGLAESLLSETQPSPR